MLWGVLGGIILRYENWMPGVGGFLFLSVVYLIPFQTAAIHTLLINRWVEKRWLVLRELSITFSFSPVVSVGNMIWLPWDSNWPQSFLLEITPAFSRIHQFGACQTHVMTCYFFGSHSVFFSLWHPKPSYLLTRDFESTTYVHARMLFVMMLILPNFSPEC